MSQEPRAGGQESNVWQQWSGVADVTPAPCPLAPAVCSLCQGPGLLENLSIFAGLDGSKAPEDLGINANMGGRVHANWGLPLWSDVGLGFQLGTGINFHNNAVAVLETVDGTHHRTESFSTVGLFQRTDCGLNWGIAWDYLAESYWDHVNLSQWRGQVGYSVTDCDEVGIWGAVHDRGDTATLVGTPLHLRPITQGNLYFRHTWANDAVTRLWIGVAEAHQEFVLILPPRAPAHHPLIYGADLYIPLCDRIALFGEASFITPNDSGTVNATLGITIALGGDAYSAIRSRFAPLLPVANNPTFAVDLRP